MSTVLTNGIIIPDNGSRNWGGDLANNWNILDVNVGYMTDVKNRVTTLENSVTENTANIQNNASNISALQTSKQDSLSEQQIANIADVTNKANDSDVVHKSGNEIISGVKTFSDNIRISNASPFCNAFCSGYIKGQAPTSNMNSGVRFFDDINSGSANTITGGFEIEYNRDGYNKTYISSRNYAGEIHKNFTVGLRVPNDDIRSIDFFPSVNDIINLGTSTNKWKTLNGINPGALSLPDYNSYLDIKGNLPASVSDGFWVSRCQIIPEQDGILILSFNDCSAAVVWTNSDLPSYGDYGTSICNEKRVMAFLLKGVPYDIYTNNYSQVALARLFYCQGNV